jgi:hypothetical protein
MDAYTQALRKAKADLAEAIKQRDHWNIEVARLNQLVKALADQLDEPPPGKLSERALIAAAGLTDLVHAVINRSSSPLSPKDVRDRLLAEGLDVTRYSNPMAMIHQSLKRLAEQGRIRELASGGYTRNAFYDALLKSVSDVKK